MVPGRRYNLRIVARLLWRRRWLISLPLFVFAGGAAALAYSLPNVYQAETTILLIPQRVPESYVRTTVTSRLEDRLRTMREQILSRTRLEGLINDLKLYPEETKTTLMEQVVVRMRDQVSITLVREGSFRIAFFYKDPVVAARVTERLSSLFIEENLRDRETQADSTSRFLEAQLDDARRRLIEQEKKLEEYRRNHSGSLPSQLGSNLQMIQSTQQQLATLNEATNRLRDRRIELNRQFQEQQESLGSLAAAPVAPPVPPGAGGPLTIQGGTATQQLESAKRNLESLQLRLRPEHPDVQRLLRQIDELEKRAEEEAASLSARPRSTVPVASNPVQTNAQNRLRDLGNQLTALDKQVAANEQEERRLQSVIAQYQGRLEQLPTRESELTELTRDYATLQTSYQSMLAKREDSVVAANLERRQIGEQFRVVDPPRVPQAPISPNRFMINAIGAALGLLLGLGTSVLLELLDTTTRTDVEVAQGLGLPTLATIPTVSTEADRSRRRRRLRVELGAVAVIVMLAGVAAWWKLAGG